MDVASITHFYAKDKLTFASTSSKDYVVDNTISELEQKLDPAQFIRIHRCSIVNSDRVREMQPLFRGEHVLILKDGTHLNVGRAFRAKLLQQMGSIVC